MPISTLSAPRAIQNGRYAEAAVNGTLVAFLTEWDVKVSTDTADTTAHGDGWQYNQALDSGWVFTAKQWVPALSVSHTINLLYSSSGIPAQVVVAGYSGTVASGTKTFEGTGTVTEANLNAPMGLMEQGFSVKGNGPPTTGV